MNRATSTENCDCGAATTRPVAQGKDERVAASFQQDIDRLRHAAIPPQGLFIDGRAAPAMRGRSFATAGVVHVNTYGGADITVPLGGFKQSGFGRDKSLHAFAEYTDLRTAWIAL